MSEVRLPKHKRIHPTEDTRAEMCSKYAQGLSTRQIASQLGVSASCIHRHIQRTGLSRTASEANILRFPPTSQHWRSSRQAARKVWERNRGPIPKGFHIHHKDGDHTNNAVENLEPVWGPDHTRLHHTGENSPNARLSTSEINAIRSLVSSGCTQTAVARRFGTSLSNVNGIVHKTRRVTG